MAVRLSTHEVAKLSGISVRTLQYYDKIGLLMPAGHTHARYRQYDMTNLLQLQQILLYKELGFGLKDIRLLLENTDPHSRLVEQQRLLENKEKQIQAMLVQVKSLLEGETKMDFEVFKKTMRSQLIQSWDTEDVSEKEELVDKYLAKLKPEDLMHVKNAWGEEKYLELVKNPIFSKEDLPKLGEKLNNYKDAILKEPDKSVQSDLIEEWIDFMMDLSHSDNREYLIQSYIKAYRGEGAPYIIQLIDKNFGKGASRRLADLLELHLIAADK